jgi:hypothetical protein
MRRAVIALLAVLLAAFAPAPFPKASRAPSDEISLKTFQGHWQVVTVRYRLDGGEVPHTWRVTGVWIDGDAWVFVVKGRYATRYSIAIGGGKPAALDFFDGPPDGGRTPDGWGLIRRKGDVVEIIYTFAGSPRAESFERPPDRQWMLTLRRQK